MTDELPADQPSADSLRAAVVAVRGIVRHRDRLLLVSDAAGYWYAPGGRLEPGESLPACLIREIQEETGLHAQVHDLAGLSEFRDDDTGEHKIECFFDATLIDPPEVLEPWRDTAGTVTRFGLFDWTQLSRMDVRPRFLADTPPHPAERGGAIYLPASP